jgi:dienelactone hydrolase
MRGWRTAARAAGIAALVAAVLFVHRYYAGAAFVARAAGAPGLAGRMAGWAEQPITEDPVRIPWRGGTLRGRRYEPEQPGGRPILLVPGVHASGIDEPRLVDFARTLAAFGHPTVTAELPDLMRYRITPRSTDMIVDAALWLSRQPGLPDDGRIGLVGISFAGGLSIVAAGRPRLRNRLEWVLSFGGHGDLPRTLRYLSTGIEPDGSRRPPHDYGVAIILLDTAARIVPQAQVAPLQQAILSFLEASRLDLLDKAAASREFARARELATSLDEPSRTLMAYVNNRDVGHLGPILAPHLTTMGGDPALSPDRSPPPDATVYLLHGLDDNVVPASESAGLAASLRAQGVTVKFLATPLVTHAAVDRAAALSSIWPLVRFWSGVLRQ